MTFSNLILVLLVLWTFCFECDYAFTHTGTTHGRGRSSPKSQELPVRQLREKSVPRPLGYDGKSHHRHSMLVVSDAMVEVSPFVVAGVAIGLGVAAQGFINQMLEGDQGLGAYLKDGSGYNKSGFRQATGSTKTTEDANRDPLPWLKLPRLDFVEVAGQTDRQEEEAIYRRLEELRAEMNDQLEKGNVEDATATREELERLMTDAGFEFNAD